MSTVGNDALIAGRYRLVELIGSGGMGSVWRADDQVLGRPVAVKLLRAEWAADEGSRRRLRAEARAAASINHPNVVGVFDYGEQPTADGEPVPFLVMELVGGNSLASELASNPTLPSSTVTTIIEQTATGLSAAHARGVVHRDIKPANLLLSPTGLVKITDFGIARAADATSLTRTGTVVGTAQYLSPEQANGRDATSKSDLYSLGVVAFACLSGVSPFARESAMATLFAHVRDPVPPLPPETPAGLRRLVTDLLAKNPDERPEAEEVVARCRAGLPLGDAGAGSPPTQCMESTPTMPAGDMQPTLVADRPDQASTAAMHPPVRQPARRGQPRRALLIGVSAAAAAALAALLVVFVVPSGSPTHGTVVRPTVATGTVEVTLAAYRGLPFATAASKLTALGLHPSESLVTNTATAGSVVSISPSGRIPAGSTVTVGVATAPTTTAPTTTSTTTSTTTAPETTTPVGPTAPAPPGGPPHGHPGAGPGPGKRNGKGP